MTDALIVFSTFANEADAARVVRALVEERLIACGNIVARRALDLPLEGRDRGRRARCMVLMKTRKQDWSALMARLHDLHPYETPECVAVRMAAGAPRYMEWLEQSLAPEGA